jgi:hypothetical protein
MPAATAAHGLEDNAAKGRKSVNLSLSGRAVQHVQFKAKLEEKGFLTSQGDCAEDG